MVLTAAYDASLSVLFLVISYLIGSIPFGLLLGKAFKGIDIREYGSGNIGSTNAIRVLGKKVGYLVFLCDVLKGMLELGDFDFVQIQLNYMDVIHDPGLEGYKLLEEKNIPVVIMEPLKGGTLAQIPDELAKPFKEISDASYASFAFRWLGQFKNIKVILSGMNAMDQLEDNINTFSNYLPLSKEELQAVAKVKQNIISVQKVPCTGCKYCMPCPEGVNIPGNFKVWNTISFKKMTASHGWINDTGFDSSSSPLKCVACGKCMVHCPQHIKIPEMIKQMINELHLKKD